MLEERAWGVSNPRNAKDSTVIINTPMGQTTLRWTSGQSQNFTSGFQILLCLAALLDNFQNSLPWSAQFTEVGDG